MQELSERILQQNGLDLASQLVRNKPLPPWMVNLLAVAKHENRAWWHVYLDNYAGGQLVSSNGNNDAGQRLHELAERAWQITGVLSSEKKRKAAVTEAEELGGFLDGKVCYLGGSPSRFLKLLHGTLWMLDQPLLSKKLVQILAGRWIHVMQFKRATMSFFERTWELTGGKGFQQGIHAAVKREFFFCLLSIPLMHCFLGATVGTVTTASDASSIGGAIGISKQLTPQGASFVKAALHNQLQPSNIPVLVISLFGGIGGAFRAYDLLGVSPLGMVHFDTHEPANRIVSRRWPHAEIFGDVKMFNKDLLRDLLARYLNITEIHVWAGFPCTDLSSARANRQGLLGPASSLFFEVKRIRKWIVEEVGGHLTVKLIVENVASMNRKEADIISDHLQLQPYFMDSADAVPMHRPRLCWTTESIEGTFEDVHVYDEGRWRKVIAQVDYPEGKSWIEPGCSWPGGEEGYVLPTAMKAIVRQRPPLKPAGIQKCSWETLQRYEADQYRYAPYQYQGRARRARAFGSDVPTSKQDDETFEAEDENELGSQLRSIRRAKVFGSGSDTACETFQAEEENSPIGSSLRAIRRARAFGDVAAVRAQFDGDNFEAEEENSPIGSSLRAIRRARAFGDVAAVRAQFDANDFEAEEENSPIGSRLRAIRRAQAFGNVAAVRAQFDGDDFEAEEENSPIGSRLRAIRRARAFGALPGAPLEVAEVPEVPA
eukprot:s1339_g18.t1